MTLFKFSITLRMQCPEENTVFDRAFAAIWRFSKHNRLLNTLINEISLLDSMYVHVYMYVSFHHSHPNQKDSQKHALKRVPISVSISGTSCNPYTSNPVLLTSKVSLSTNISLADLTSNLRPSTRSTHPARIADDIRSPTFSTNRGVLGNELHTSAH